MKQFAATTIALVAIAALAVLATTPARPAIACTGGFGGSLEQMAQSDNIALVEVITAGDGVNRAPTLTPTVTASATPTTAAGTPEPTPPSPPVQPLAPPTASVPFDVTGFGASLRVIETYAGNLPPVFDIDTEVRNSVENEARAQDAGAISSCEPGQFAYRYDAGARYLLFTGEFEQLGLITFIRYRIDGDAMLIRDPDVDNPTPNPLDPDLPTLLMTREVYDRLFTPLPFVNNDGFSVSSSVYIDGDRAPLANVLEAIALIRGGITITPPDAGNAGLKPTHPLN